jgi:aminopeptidase N
VRSSELSLDGGFAEPQVVPAGAPARSGSPLQKAELAVSTQPNPKRLALLVTILAAASCGQGAPPPDTSQGVSWELAQQRKGMLSDLSYRITLDIPAERSQPIEGRSVVSFRLHDPEGADVVLDFKNPTERIHALRVNGADVSWSGVNDHIVVPARAFHDGSNELDVTYTAGDDALNRHDDFLYTLFVPDRAHYSIPVFDQPNLKARVEWALHIPQGWKAVANGPLSRREIVAGKQALLFLPTKPISTYLFAFAAGHFHEEMAVRDGRTYHMYCRETDSTKVARNRDAIFDLHAAAVKWLESYTGIPYPFQKFDFVLIPSFQYGGMEHPGAIFYQQSSLLLDASATQAQILGRAQVISHETSHMWFGDLVTMNWFDDVWTKEVFANFMAGKIVRPSFPNVNHDLRFLMANFPAAYAVDRTAGANAIRQPLENLDDAGSLYGAIIYEKAPIVMRHLEARVGVDAFRDGLRTYLHTYAYGNATWPDLIAILDKSSPENLSAWSHDWVDQPGRPTITVRRDSGAVVIAPSDPEGKGRVWPQRLEVRLGYARGDTLVGVELGARPVRLNGVRVAGLRWVLPNGSGMEYGGFVLDPASLAYLSTHVGELQPALVRGAAWVTLWDQVLDERLAPGAFLDEALASLGSETNEQNLSRILGYLEVVYWRLLPAKERLARAPEVERVLWRGVTGSLPVTARASFFDAYRSTALTAAGVDRLRKLWSGRETIRGLPLSQNDRTALADALALRGVSDAAHILDEQEARIHDPDRLARFRFVRPSLSADPARRLAFFDSLKNPANRRREPWVLAGLENIHHPLRSASAIGTIRPALEMIEEVQRTGDVFFPGRWLDATLGGDNEAEAADTVQAFLAGHPDLPKRLREKIEQSADMLYRSARIVHGWKGGE